MDSGLVGDVPHQATQGIDFADELALADAADCRVARHLADLSQIAADQRRGYTHARGRGCSLDTGVPAADDNDLEISHSSC